VRNVSISEYERSLIKLFASFRRKFLARIPLEGTHSAIKKLFHAITLADLLVSSIQQEVFSTKLFFLKSISFSAELEEEGSLLRCSRTVEESLLYKIVGKSSKLLFTLLGG
jgi:hypothetical protein